MGRACIKNPAGLLLSVIIRAMMRGRMLHLELCSIVCHGVESSPRFKCSS